jgi:phosphoserine phosphatase RsbU/P
VRSDRTRVLAKLRHDLRTPINAILGYCDLLKEDLARSQVNGLDDLNRIAAAGRQLLAVIEAGLSDEHFGDFHSISSAAETSRSTGKNSFTAALRAFPSERQSEIAGRILVVDDQPENRDVLVKHLERQGHRTAQAEDGQRALAMLSREAFDLVLLDVAMPVMEGYLVLERVKADPQLRHLPVVMISAVDELETVARCIEAGAEDFLPKPFNPTLLRARIDASLEKKFLRDQERSHLHRIEETQKRLANELQEAARYVVSALPPPMSEPLKIAWTYEPSTELGGDSFGYHWIDENHLAVYLLDVCGHGVGAALLSVAAINVIRSAGLRDTDFFDPGQVLSSLNEAFQMESHNNMFFTIWYGVYDVAARSIRHASGGHPPALLLKSDVSGADVLEELRCPGMLVGAMPNVSYKSATSLIPENSRLFVFCDGAYEIARPDGTRLDFDSDFAPYLLRNGRSLNIPEQVLSWIRSVHGSETLTDDFSFLAIDFPK